MSTPFYDLASLVVVPSGYKSGKVYAQKPMTTDGQLTFTRASSATRVASNGLIEKVRTNLALYSEEFSNAYWTKSTATITDNTAANPINGAITADTLTRTGGASGFLRRQISQTGIVAFSVFAKSGSTNLVRLNVYDGSTDRGATYNLTTGAITTVYGSPLFTLAQNFGSGWYRISISVNAATYSDCQIHLDSVNSVIIFATQLETGDIATPYIATTTAAVSVGPVSGLPRLDYYDSTCPKLLLEPQRSNLVLFSEQLNAASWSASTTTVTANAEISPDGYQNADVLAMSASQSRVSQVLSLGAGTYSVSVYAKAISGSGTARILVIIDGVSTDFNFTPTTSWARYSFTFTAATSVTAVQMRAQTFIGNLSFWGCQLEVGAYPTSYIPTLGASQTRVADAASKTGISSLINSAEGVLYFEGSAIANDGVGKAITLLANASNFVKILFSTTTNRVDYVCISAGAVSCNIVKTIANTTANNKIAIKWKNNDFALWINGVKEGVDVSGNAPIGMSILNFTNEGAGELFYGNVKSTIIFPITLTDSQLAELTAL